MIIGEKMTKIYRIKLTELRKLVAEQKYPMGTKQVSLRGLANRKAKEFYRSHSKEIELKFDKFVEQIRQLAFDNISEIYEGTGQTDKEDGYRLIEAVLSYLWPQIFGKEGSSIGDIRDFDDYLGVDKKLR